MWTRHLANANETQDLGRLLGQTAECGTVVALVGDLGAGKTTFAQGVGEGLAVLIPIVSPTFILMSEYDDGRLPLLHGDTYRLESGELEAIGLEELVEDWTGIVLLEWADRFPELLPDDHLLLSLVHAEDGRTATMTATGPRHEILLARIQELAGE